MKKPRVLPLIVLSVFVLNACTFNGSIKKDFYAATPASDKKIPLKIALLRDKNVESQYIWHSDGALFTWKYAAGAAFQNASQIALSRLFEEVRLVESPKDALSDDLMVTLNPEFPSTIGLRFWDPQTNTQVARFEHSSQLQTRMGEQDPTLVLIVLIVLPIYAVSMMIYGSDDYNPSRTIRIWLDLIAAQIPTAEGLRPYVNKRTRDAVAEKEARLGAQAERGGDFDAASGHYAKALENSWPGSQSELELRAKVARACEKAAEEAASRGENAKVIELYGRILEGRHDDAMDRRVRAKIFKHALSLSPSLPVPEQVARHQVRGGAILKHSSGPEGYAQAIAEFERAIAAAPWVASSYFNLALVQEKAADYSGAIRNMELYLAAAPRADDAQAVRKKIYELEATRELKNSK